MSTIQPISITQLSIGIKQVLQQSLPQHVWVWGEVNSLAIRGGHCYIDLVEKASGSDQLQAKIRCNVWQWNWRNISEKFLKVTGQPLAQGLTVQLLVQVDYHPLYSLSVSAVDVDPTYTLGSLQRRRLEIIESLRTRGLLARNGRLPIPTLLQRIAVISSASAAGYSDFCHQLLDNGYGFAYQVELFQSMMQGVQTEESLIAALHRVALRVADFDVVVIIRGGGATSDLYAFDSLPIAEVCAAMPLPVLTGIGHQRDESVLDMVAHTALKTPTAVAEFIIQHTLYIAERLDTLAITLQRSVQLQLRTATAQIANFAVRLPSATSLYVNQQRQALTALANSYRHSSTQLIAEQKTYISTISSQISAVTMLTFSRQRNRLDSMQRLIPLSVRAIVTQGDNRLRLLETKLTLLDPRRLLERGYSMTLSNGRLLTDIHTLHQGDTIITIFATGSVESRVEQVIEYNIKKLPNDRYR